VKSSQANLSALQTLLSIFCVVLLSFIIYIQQWLLKMIFSLNEYY
jgi:hypothetical protein